MGTPPDNLPEDLQRKILAARMNQAGRSRKPGGCCLLNFAGVIGMLVLAGAFLIGFDYLLVPWAWGVFGRPTLTGEWAATFRLPAGQRGAIYLNLTHNPNEDFRGSRLGRNLPPL